MVAAGAFELPGPDGETVGAVKIAAIRGSRIMPATFTLEEGPSGRIFSARGCLSDSSTWRVLCTWRIINSAGEGGGRNS